MPYIFRIHNKNPFSDLGTLKFLIEPFHCTSILDAYTVIVIETNNPAALFCFLYNLVVLHFPVRLASFDWFISIRWLKTTFLPYPCIITVVQSTANTSSDLILCRLILMTFLYNPTTTTISRFLICVRTISQYASTWKQNALLKNATSKSKRIDRTHLSNIVNNFHQQNVNLAGQT